MAGDRLLRRGDYGARHTLRGVELAGRTLGIVGCGRIGARLAQMARAAFDMRVAGFDPYLDAARVAALGIELVSDLPALLRPADVVSVHTPLTAATVGLLGADELAAMKPRAYLINTSRGGVVDELALAAALRAGQLAGAGLDVLEQEPPPAGPPPAHPGERHPHPPLRHPDRRSPPPHLRARQRRCARRPPWPATTMVRQPRGLGKLITHAPEIITNGIVSLV